MWGKPHSFGVVFLKNHREPTAWNAMAESSATLRQKIRIIFNPNIFYTLKIFRLPTKLIEQGKYSLNEAAVVAIAATAASFNFHLVISRPLMLHTDTK